MAPRIPTADDFAHLAPDLTFTLHYPDPPESTTAFLLLLHGLGDSHLPYTTLARNLSLPATLAIAIRGPAPLPAFLLDQDESAASTTGGESVSAGHFHWGDDLRIDPCSSSSSSSSAIDPDPGFSQAATLVLDRLVRGTIVGRLGWDLGDVLVWGLGQGGSLALGMAARIEEQQQRLLSESSTSATTTTTAATLMSQSSRHAFGGVVSIGGGLPASMATTNAGGHGVNKAKTKVLLVQVGEDEADRVTDDFSDVVITRWRGTSETDVRMPRNREEMLPIMKFFAERLAANRPFMVS